MPCTSEPGRMESELRSINVRLTRMLCLLCTGIDSGCEGELLIQSNDELREWWQRHKAQDESDRQASVRSAAEARLRASALSKLTDREREVLGLNRG